MNNTTGKTIAHYNGLITTHLAPLHGMPGGTSYAGCTFNWIPSAYNTPLATGSLRTSKTACGDGKYAHTHLCYFTMTTSNGGHTCLCDATRPMWAIETNVVLPHYPPTPSLSPQFSLDSKYMCLSRLAPLTLLPSRLQTPDHCP